MSRSESKPNHVIIIRRSIIYIMCVYLLYCYCTITALTTITTTTTTNNAVCRQSYTVIGVCVGTRYYTSINTITLVFYPGVEFFFFVH